MTTVAIEAKIASQPRLSPAEHAEYDQIFKRLCRALADQRRAQKRDDAKLLASAERRIARARADRATLVAPHVDPLWAPTRILCTFKAHWNGKDDTGAHVAGKHVHVCEMILDHKDFPGPEYRTVRVLRDEGAPSKNPRQAPHTMGVAWFALQEQIDRGKIVVLDEEAAS